MPGEDYSDARKIHPERSLCILSWQKYQYLRCCDLVLEKRPIQAVTGCYRGLPGQKSAWEWLDRRVHASLRGAIVLLGSRDAGAVT